MRRDMNLVRAILLELERITPLEGLFFITIPDHPKEEVNYHLLLLKDAQLIEGPTLRIDGGGQTVLVEKLTWAAHEFLDLARDGAVWIKAMQIVRANGGSVSFDVLKALLAKLNTPYRNDVKA